MERNDYEVIVTDNGVSLSGNSARNVVGFRFVEGACVSQSLDFIKLDRETYLREVLAPLVALGKVSDREERDASGKITKYDDRKLRVDSMSIPASTSGDDVLHVASGISYFGAFRADQTRSEDECLVMQEKGRDEYGDRWAYFQRNPGIAGLVLSESGVPYVGERTNKERQGSLNATAGHLAYREDVSKVNLFVDLYREMHEEFGVLPGDVEAIRFVGAFENPLRGDFDFTFVVETNLPDSYFALDGAWRQRRVSEEHEELIALATPDDVRMLLEEGRVQDRKAERFNVMYSTRGALESLAAGF